jgi:hypothetical protein
MPVMFCITGSLPETEKFGDEKLIITERSEKDICK